MSRITLLGGVIALVAALAPAAHADLRIEERVTTLDSSATRWTFIKGDRRSVVTRQNTDGLLFDAGARYGARVEIARPDLELLWELDPQEKSYREVTADQFTRILQKGVQAPRDPNDQPLRTLYRSETTAIEVVPTGKTRRIAGLPTEEVVARVVVGATNLRSGNRFSYTFDQTLWITKDERVVNEARAFEQAYTEAFGSQITLAQAELLSGEWNDAFVTHVRAMGDRIRALGGYPLSVTTTVTEEALAQAKNERNNARKLTVGTVEVSKISFDSLLDSEFELPVGYINRDTKVAVAPKPGVEVPAVAPVPVVKPAETTTPPTRVVESKTETAPGTPVATTGASPAGAGPVTTAVRPPAEPAETPAPSTRPAPVIATTPEPKRTPGGLPTNVVSSNDPKTKTPTTFKPSVTPVIVSSVAGVSPRDNVPVLSASGVTRVVTPTLVTVDEPEHLTRKGKKRK